MIKSAGTSPNNVIRRAGLTTMSAFEYKAQYNAAFLQEADDFAAYSSVDKGAAAKVCTYTEGVSQYAVQNTPGDPGSRYVRFQDLYAGYALSLTISSLAIEQNAKPQVAVKALGATGDIASKDAAEMKVVKKTASHAWIVDNADKNGYVIKLAD